MKRRDIAIAVAAAVLVLLALALWPLLSQQAAQQGAPIPSPQQSPTPGAAAPGLEAGTSPTPGALQPTVSPSAAPTGVSSPFPSASPTPSPTGNGSTTYVENRGSPVANGSSLPSGLEPSVTEEEARRIFTENNCSEAGNVTLYIDPIYLETGEVPTGGHPLRWQTPFIELLGHSVCACAVDAVSGEFVGRLCLRM